MTWEIIFSHSAQAFFDLLSENETARISFFLRELEGTKNPRKYGQGVSASWRYFVDEFALVAQIDDRLRAIRIGMIYSVSLDEADEGKSHVFWSSKRYH
jgi:mRNA-degrading endonuclease RelE of RelBE toxin-antitoxin system